VSRGLASCPPGWILAGALTIPGLVVPLTVGRWMQRHGYAFGEMTVTTDRGREFLSIDSRWTLPVIGMGGALWYGLPAGFMLWILRNRASRRTRNLAILALLPLMIGAMWLLVTPQR